MKEPPPLVRNYRPGDLAAYVLLHVDAEMADRAGRSTSMTALCEVLGRPGFSPERDLFVAEVDGAVVGCVILTPESGIGRVILECLVHPEHRRKGLATELCRVAERRGMELGAKVLQGSCDEGNIPARGLVSALGFRYVHRFLELELALSQSAPTAAADPECRHLRLGEESTLAELQNRSFAGTWGYNPGTVEEISYRLNLSDSSPEGVVLVQHRGELAGYCWTTIDDESSAASDPRRGRVHMIGILPGIRGAGLGRRVLMAGLASLAVRGAKVVDLSVDSENTAAIALYNSVG
ncbi:MAG: GNAT family N-acetyltransferase, partial [Dehalococcoidia bacterium]